MIRVKDPVCGREFDLGDAHAYEDFRGWAYFFCSGQCHGRFVAHPDRFVGEKPRTGTGVSSQAESREAPRARQRGSRHG